MKTLRRERDPLPVISLVLDLPAKMRLRLPILPRIPPNNSNSPQMTIITGESKASDKHKYYYKTRKPKVTIVRDPLKEERRDYVQPLFQKIDSAIATFEKEQLRRDVEKKAHFEFYGKSVKSKRKTTAIIKNLDVALQIALTCDPKLLSSPLTKSLDDTWRITSLPDPGFSILSKPPIGSKLYNKGEAINLNDTCLRSPLINIKSNFWEEVERSEHHQLQEYKDILKDHGGTFLKKETHCDILRLLSKKTIPERYRVCFEIVGGLSQSESLESLVTGMSISKRSFARAPSLDRLHKSDWQKTFAIITFGTRLAMLYKSISRRNQEGLKTQKSSRGDEKMYIDGGDEKFSAQVMLFCLI